MAEQSIPEAALRVYSLLHLVETGDFYQDYDESSEVLGRAKDGFATLERALTELQAKVMEYEHVLGHVVDPHPVPGATPQTACSECQRMAQSALDGTYRDDFREEVLDGE